MFGGPRLDRWVRFPTSVMPTGLSTGCRASCRCGSNRPRHFVEAAVNRKRHSSLTKLGRSPSSEPRPSRSERVQTNTLYRYRNHRHGRAKWVLT